MKRVPELKIERVRQALSQVQLAKAAGCSQPFLSLLETGQRTPSRKTAEAISHVLNVPLERIFLEAPE